MTDRVIDKENLIPTHFNSREGGMWVKYYGSGYSLKTLEGAIRERLPNLIRGSEITEGYSLVATQATKVGPYMQYRVHALLWDNQRPSARWDEWSGWTTEIPTIPKEIPDENDNI